MSKPLTIEELKVLPVGEWVWVVPSDDIFTPYYGQINKYTDRPFDEELWVNSQTNIIVLYYSDYGKTWLAYKNKEMAEAKGEIVEMPCKVGDKLYGFVPYPDRVEKVKFLGVGYEVIDKNRRHSFGNLGINLFTDKSQAEARLKVLKGEGV
ncbi:MAG: hypothetical protein K2N32_04340 [Clostridia bacterium]|nr:hypothetical protein [Clostridia bacterium]